MGKGAIISGGIAGLYNVRVNYQRTRYLAMIAQLNTDIAQITTDLAVSQSSITAKEAEMNALAAQIAVYESDKETYQKEYCAAVKSMTALLSAYYALQNKINVLTLKQKSKEVRLAYLTDNMPADPVLPAWCTDLTENLTGEVGTIEVPGERGTVMIQPGYEGNASYDAVRDGQLQPAIAATPESAFYNLAMLPGWQKWKPTYRFGTITSLNLAAVEGGTDYCDVALDAALSSKQSLDVNQATQLLSVPITYMTCNGAAFKIGDEVIVQFTDQDWTKPRVIGFKNNPKSCEECVVFLVGNGIAPKSAAVVWDIKKGCVADIPDVTFPCDSADVNFAAWLADKEKNSSSMLGAMSWDTESPYKISPDLADTAVEIITDYESCTLEANDPTEGSSWGDDLRGVATSIGGIDYHAVSHYLTGSHKEYPVSLYATATVGRDDSYIGFQTSRQQNDVIDGCEGWLETSDEVTSSAEWVAAGHDVYFNDITALGQRWLAFRYSRTRTIQYVLNGPYGQLAIINNVLSGDYTEFANIISSRDETEKFVPLMYYQSIDHPTGYGEKYFDKLWYSVGLRGAYTSSNFALVASVEFNYYTRTFFHKNYVTEESWTFPEDACTITVHAQAAKIPGDGDWLALGKNDTLSGLLEDAVRAVYTLNGIDTRLVLGFTISTDIYR